MQGCFCQTWVRKVTWKSTSRLYPGPSSWRVCAHSKLNFRWVILYGTTFLCILVLARTGLACFAVSRRGHGWDTEVVLYHLSSLLGWGERESLLGGRDSLWSRKGGGEIHLILSIIKSFSVWIFYLIIPFAINIVADIVNFLSFFSLLFPTDVLASMSASNWRGEGSGTWF